MRKTAGHRSPSPRVDNPTTTQHDLDQNPPDYAIYLKMTYIEAVRGDAKLPAR